MATKHVKETLGQFQDWKYFSLLEEKAESKDDKKYKDEEAKDGMDAIKKLRDNLSRFETASGGKILKYKEFWEENQKVADGFDEEGDIFKLWDSDYVAGVLTLPDEALSDDELNAKISEVDEKTGKDQGEEDVDDKEDAEEEAEDDAEDAIEDIDDEDEEAEEEDEEDKDKEDEEDLEEGNAFGKAVKDAKKKGKKDFKVGGKKFPVKESWRPDGEEFRLFEAEEAEEEAEEETEDKEEGAGDFAGFDPDALDLGSEEEGEESEGKGSEEDVEVEDGEAIELDGDLDGDGEAEGGMEFGNEGESHEYFVIYDMSGGDREEVFRTDNPKVIEEFKNFFENEWKAAVRTQIQQFKEAQEEKKREAEAKAKEELRQKQKANLDKFLKESDEGLSAYDKLKMAHPEWNWAEAEEIDPEDLEAAAEYYDRMSQNEAFDTDDYEEPFVMPEEEFVEDEEEGEEYSYQVGFDHWKEDLIEILVNEFGWDEEEAINVVEEEELDEAFRANIDINDIAEGIDDRYNS